MDKYTSTEIAYKNGYNQAIEDFKIKLKARNKLYCTNSEDLREMNFVIDNIIRELREAHYVI